MREVLEGVALMVRSAGRGRQRAAAWRCPACELRLLSHADFTRHLKVGWGWVWVGVCVGGGLTPAGATRLS